MQYYWERIAESCRILFKDPPKILPVSLVKITEQFAVTGLDSIEKPEFNLDLIISQLKNSVEKEIYLLTRKETVFLILKIIDAKERFNDVEKYLSKYIQRRAHWQTYFLNLLFYLELPFEIRDILLRPLSKDHVPKKILPFYSEFLRDGDYLFDISIDSSHYTAC